MNAETRFHQGGGRHYCHHCKATVRTKQVGLNEFECPRCERRLRRGVGPLHRNTHGTFRR